MVSNRVADSFSLVTASEITSINFWYTYANNGFADDVGPLSYAIYSDNFGAPGDLVYGENDIPLADITQTPVPGLGCSPTCVEASFNLNVGNATTVLAAGSYWLEIHPGTTLTDPNISNSGDIVYWQIFNPGTIYFSSDLAQEPNTPNPGGGGTAFQILGSSVPEPSSVGLVLIGVAVFASKRRPRARRVEGVS
jgi:hypothetical protein